jgi:hypothetical protein
MSIPAFPPTAYGLTRPLPAVPCAEAVARTRSALATEGFGMLTESDVRDDVILGACNPPRAHRALTEAPGVGLLLPCNVVVSADEAGGSVVAAVDPLALFAVLGRPGLEGIAGGVRERLVRALYALAPAGPGAP